MDYSSFCKRASPRAQCSNTIWTRMPCTPSCLSQLSACRWRMACMSQSCLRLSRWRMCRRGIHDRTNIQKTDQEHTCQPYRARTSSCCLHRPHSNTCRWRTGYTPHDREQIHSRSRSPLDIQCTTSALEGAQSSRMLPRMQPTPVRLSSSCHRMSRRTRSPDHCTPWQHPSPSVPIGCSGMD